MVHITSYYSKNFGFTFPEACIEVFEVNTRKAQSFFDGEGSKNTLVRLNVWATEQAKTDGRQPVEQIERYLNLDQGLLETINENALSSLFPETINS